MYMPPSLGKPSLTFVQYGQEQQTSVIYKSDNTEAARLPDYPTTVPRDTTTCTAFGGGMEGQIFPWARHTRGRATRVPQKCIHTLPKTPFFGRFLADSHQTANIYLVPGTKKMYLVYGLLCTACSVLLLLLCRAAATVRVWDACNARTLTICTCWQRLFLEY